MDGHTQVAQLLQEYGAEVDAQEFYDDTSLTLASYFEKFEVVRLLLGRGADVHLKDNDGASALYWATEHGHTEIAQLLLLDHGAKGG